MLLVSGVRMNTIQNAPGLLQLFESSLDLKRFRSFGHLTNFSNIVVLGNCCFVVVNSSVEERGLPIHTSFRRNLLSLSSCPEAIVQSMHEHLAERCYLDSSLPFDTAWLFL